MSKKTERDAQVRKARVAKPALREGAGEAATNPVKARPAAPRRPRKPLPRRVFWTLVGLGPIVAFFCFCFLASAIWPPVVPIPGPFMPGLGATLQVLNPSFLPIYRVEYSCTFQSVVDESGFGISATQGNPDKEQRAVLYRGNRADAECRSRINLQGIRPKSAESVVSLSYVPFGWPFRRTAEYRMVADLDPLGTVRRWALQ